MQALEGWRLSKSAVTTVHQEPYEKQSDCQCAWLYMQTKTKLALDSQLWAWSSYHKASVVGHFKTRVQYRVASMCKGLVTAINNVNTTTNKPFLILLVST